MAPVFHTEKKLSAPKSILYLQHADDIGGSVISLREVVVDALAHGYACTVICRNEKVASIYEAIGARALVGLIAPFNHNSAFFYRATPKDAFRLLRLLYNTLRSFAQLKAVIQRVNPDVVHLNSSTLFLYIPYLRMIGFACIIYHVREYVVSGYLGLRKSIICTIANRATFIIYISEFERSLLKTESAKSIVIYNYVHEKVFLKYADQHTRNLPKGQKFSVITLGGLFRLKGGEFILRAVATSHNMELVVLGGTDPRVDPEELRRLEGDGYVTGILELLKDPEVSSRVKFAGKVPNPVSYIQAADALVFWAGSPHFPRPVFEAWLLRVPVIYFNPLFSNPVITGENVWIVAEETVAALKSTLVSLIDNRENYGRNIEQAFLLARKFFTEANFEHINRIYQQCISNE